MSHIQAVSDLERIQDPITVSLRASNSIDSEGFRDPFKNNPGTLFEARVLDIWTTNLGYLRERIYWNPSKQLPPDVLDPQAQRPPEARDFVTRLLVTSPTVDASGIPRFRSDWWVDQRQLDFLPFVPKSMEALFKGFNLPMKWFWYRSHAYAVGNFYRTTSWDRKVAPSKPDSIGFVIHFPFTLRPARDSDRIARPLLEGSTSACKDDAFLWSLAFNYSFRSRTTRGILDGLTHHAFDDLYSRILRHGGQWTLHPLHIPIILLQYHIDHAAWDMDDMACQLSEFNRGLVEQNQHPLDKFQRLTSRLAHLGRDIKFQAEFTRFLADTLRYLDESVFHPDGHYPDNELLQVGRQMHEKLVNFQYLTENYLESCRFLEIKTKSALDYINAKFNQQDNKENRRSREFQNRGLQAQLDDARNASVIAILGLVFLPATAVAAITNLTAFQWQKPGGGQYQIQFGWFWLISFLLTMIVIATYVVFQRRWLDKREGILKYIDDFISSEESLDRESLRPRSSPSTELEKPVRARRRRSTAGSRHHRASRDRSHRHESDLV